MDQSQLTKIVENAISNLISSEPFLKAAKRNWVAHEGKEEELCPYFTEMIRRQSKCEIQGIGWGRFHDRSEKGDFLCYFNVGDEQNTFSIELKNPSKDKTPVSKGLQEDIKKLNQLMEDGIIQYGVAAGLWLIDIDKEKNDQEVKKISTINLSQVVVYGN